MWMPGIFDRTNMENLQEGHILDAGARAQKRAMEIIETHEPEPISQGAMQDLDEVTRRWHQDILTNNG
jgi:trimethylamine:corrinoid methyltransferase-like protein